MLFVFVLLLLVENKPVPTLLVLNKLELVLVENKFLVPNSPGLLFPKRLFVWFLLGTKLLEVSFLLFILWKRNIERGDSLNIDICLEGKNGEFLLLSDIKILFI